MIDYTQYTLDEALAIWERNIAMDVVDMAADADWRATALRAVEEVARQKTHLTTDDVLEVLAQSGQTTSELRALGPVMMRAAQAGWITATDRFVNSAAVSRHHAPKRVWKSNINRTNRIGNP